MFTKGIPPRPWAIISRNQLAQGTTLHQNTLINSNKKNSYLRGQQGKPLGSSHSKSTFKINSLKPDQFTLGVKHHIRVQKQESEPGKKLKQSNKQRDAQRIEKTYRLDKKKSTRSVSSAQQKSHKCVLAITVQTISGGAGLSIKQQ